MRRLLWLLLPALATAGCTVTATAIRRDFSDFNQTIHYNESQQMLLNLVRLKYRELPLFLKVGALSASYGFEVSGEGSVGRAGPTGLWSAEGSTSYSTRPTITYTPLSGDTFVKQVLAEVDPDTFFLLVRSGWPIEVLGNILVERIGKVINNEGEESYGDFLQLIDTLAEAQENDDLTFVRQGEEVFLKVVTDRAGLYTDARADRPQVFRISTREFQLRSLLDIMFFLGKNTDVPEEHLDQVRSGDVNGWMAIRSHRNEPEDAVVSVQHNGWWFSIARNDVRSKDTFALVKLLFQMQAGDIATVQPVLTLPVAQP